MISSLSSQSTLLEETYSLFYGVTWEQFEAIATAFQDIAGTRLSYLDGNLEIMTISEEHEEIKSTVARLLEVYFRAKGIRYYVRGGPSLGEAGDRARRQPDESYNIGSKKSKPDLAIEVVITSGGINKLECYRRFQVPEVWFWEQGRLTLYSLTAEGYEQIFQSRLLPDLELGLLVRHANMPDQYDAVTAYTAALM